MRFTSHAKKKTNKRAKEAAALTATTSATSATAIISVTAITSATITTATVNLFYHIATSIFQYSGEIALLTDRLRNSSLTSIKSGLSSENVILAHNPRI